MEDTDPEHDERRDRRRHSRDHHRGHGHHRSHHHERSRDHAPAGTEKKPRFEAIAQQRMMPSADQVTKGMHQRAAMNANWKKVLEAAKAEAERVKAEEAAEADVQKTEAAVQDAADRLEKIAKAAKFHGPTSGMILATEVGTLLVAARERGKALTCRERGFLLLNEPASGRVAQVMELAREQERQRAATKTLETPPRPAHWL